MLEVEFEYLSGHARDGSVIKFVFYEIYLICVYSAWADLYVIIIFDGEWYAKNLKRAELEKLNWFTRDLCWLYFVARVVFKDCVCSKALFYFFVELGL